ncbi:MAG: hypothetical protein GTN89_13105, partial [Acidobacteria bacterium]|nr:hypothetical protein [Acidobacteriota bacterium]
MPRDRPSTARAHLVEHGYVVLENLIEPELVDELKGRVDDRLEFEREHPFLPGDGPPLPSDDAFCSEYG